MDRAQEVISVKASFRLMYTYVHHEGLHFTGLPQGGEDWLSCPNSYSTLHSKELLSVEAGKGRRFKAIALQP